MKFNSFIAAGMLVFVLASPVEAQKARRGEQDAAFQAMREGAVRSLRSIENDIVPEMKARGANYIGAEFDGESLRYRLKFMKGAKVIWLDFDGKTGGMIGKAGE